MKEKNTTKIDRDYYWILADSEAGNFVDPQEEHFRHTFKNPTSNARRQDYETSSFVKKADRLIGYLRDPERIVAIFEVTNIVVEPDDDGYIEFRRTKLLAKPIEWRELKEMTNLRNAAFPKRSKRYMDELRKAYGDFIWQFAERKPGTSKSKNDVDGTPVASTINSATQGDTQTSGERTTETTTEVASPPASLDSIGNEEATSADYDGSETERDEIRTGRIGQDRFKQSLIDYWGVCAVTGCAVQKVLRASHIKPWSESESPERLDPFNGILLAAHFDALFETGLISFDDAGRLLVSAELSNDDRRLLGVDDGLRLRKIDERHRPYLSFHRKKHGYEQ